MCPLWDVLSHLNVFLTWGCVRKWIDRGAFSLVTDFPAGREAPNGPHFWFDGGNQRRLGVKLRDPFCAEEGTTGCPTLSMKVCVCVGGGPETSCWPWFQFLTIVKAKEVMVCPAPVVEVGSQQICQCPRLSPSQLCVCGKTGRPVPCDRQFNLTCLLWGTLTIPENCKV